MSKCFTVLYIGGKSLRIDLQVTNSVSKKVTVLVNRQYIQERKVSNEIRVLYILV